MLPKSAGPQRWHSEASADPLVLLILECYSESVASGPIMGGPSLAVTSR